MAPSMAESICSGSDAPQSVRKHMQANHTATGRHLHSRRCEDSAGRVAIQHRLGGCPALPKEAAKGLRPPSRFARTAKFDGHPLRDERGDSGRRAQIFKRECETVAVQPSRRDQLERGVGGSIREPRRLTPHRLKVNKSSWRLCEQHSAG
eukprot:4055500-Pleurochrysis_carterae.AAC.2